VISDKYLGGVEAEVSSQELRLVGGEIADGVRDDRTGRKTSHKSCGELG
jgi:hypothetical protein